MGALHLMHIDIRDEASVAEARERVRSLAIELGMGRIEAEGAAVIASELGHNQLRHARHGSMLITPWESDGVEILATDAGAGIEDLNSALADRRVGASLGVGLGAVRRLATELDVVVRMGEGSTLAARVRAGGRRGPEVVALGRPHRDERVSGDVFRLLRAPGRLLLALVDGLGHGPQARRAADAAIACLRVDDAPADSLQRVHESISGTRGVAMAVACVERGEVVVGVVGNVRVGVFGPDGTRRASQTPGTLGLQGASRTVHPDRLALGPQDRLVLWTDGLRDQLTIDLSLPSARLAPDLLARWGRESDDATVVVAR